MLGLTAAAFLLSTSLSLVQTGHQDIWLGTYSNSSGISFQWVVPYQRMASTPSWQGDFARLPLSFTRAVELSRAYLRTQRPGAESLPLWNISLIKVVLRDLADKWYFALAFLNVKDGAPTMDLSLATRVLLDGTVVEPAVVKKN